MSDSGMVEKSSLASERERFEAYVLLKQKGEPTMGGDWPVWKNPDGTYVYSQPEWEAWQAASAGRQELLEALEGLMELERRGRLMPIGREWDAARAAIAKATQGA